MKCDRCGKEITTEMYWEKPAYKHTEKLCNRCAGDLLAGTRTYTGLMIAFNKDFERSQKEERNV